MTPEQLEDRLQALARDVARFSSSESDRARGEFAGWFWERAERLKAEAGAELAEVAIERIDDIADGAMDAGLFGPEERG